MSDYNSEDINRLEPGYLNNYGLQEAPFSPVHQDKFMYLDAERAQRINMLQHMVRYSNLLLIVQGEHGVGKTALLNRFVQIAESDWQICEIAANTMIDAEQLLFQAAQGFGVRQLPQDAGELQEMLYARIATFHHNDQIPILIIDDAHELPKDALLAIFNLADTLVNEVNLLRIILFCEPQIEKILNSKDVKPLRERVTHTMEIPPLDEETTAEYLKHRLAVAGFNGGSPFTPKLIKKIYRASGGLPAKINALAHDVLDEGDIDTEQPVAEEFYPEVERSKKAKPVTYMTIAVLLVIIVLVFQDSINSLFEDDGQAEISEPESLTGNSTQLAESKKEQITQELDLQEKIIPISEPEKKEQEPVIKQEVPAPDKNEQLVTETNQIAENKTELTDPGVMDEPSTAATSAKEPVKPLQIHSLEPDPVPASRKQQTIKITGQGFTPSSEVLISWTDNEKKLNPSQVNIVSEGLIEIAITVGLTEDTWTLRILDPVAGQSNLQSFKVTQIDQGFRKDQWLLAQSPTSFTIQLFGSNKQSSADEFIKKHRLSDKAGYFVTQRNGKDWYSVIYGAYKDQGAARNATKALPASLKKITPWVRRMDDIQANINASRKIARTRPQKPKPIASTPPASTPSKNTSVAQNEAWLWSQDPSSYTLQLLGARQSSSIQKFLRKYTRLNGKAVFFHTRHDTRDWYTVVYGVYTDRKQAQQAIKRLPQELQSASPWIRSFGSIHAELNRAD